MKITFSSAAKAFAVTAALATGAMSAHADSHTNVPAPVITSPENVQWFPMIPEMGEKGPAMAVVFGKPGVIGQPFGGLFRVPAGDPSPLHTHSSEYWAVMQEGTESARVGENDEAMPIASGGYWFQPGKAEHINQCLGEKDCLFFVYYPNGMDYIPGLH